MPDTSLADYAAIAGAFIAAVITGLGLKRGEKEKSSLPAPSDAMSAGVFVGLDSRVEQAILDEVRGMRADQAAWRKEDREERRANEVEELKEEIADLKRGQGTTHAGQKGLADMILSRAEERLRARPGVSAARIGPGRGAFVSRCRLSRVAVALPQCRGAFGAVDAAYDAERHGDEQLQ